VNHIDTAPMYGNAEKVIGPWLAKHRNDFFVATKTRRRSRQGALDNLKRSLERLRVDYIDLWQMHGLTNPAGWEKAMGPAGALEAFLEARDKGLVRFLGSNRPRYQSASNAQTQPWSVLISIRLIAVQLFADAESPVCS